ncbi:MAG: hypothetical protein RLZZ126_220 [Pseudomonadota bacterium]|jgi:hypothetical protein
MNLLDCLLPEKACDALARGWSSRCLSVWCLVFPVMVQAQGGFSSLISPPRVETTLQPGRTTRLVLEVSQVGPAPGRLKVYTNDWKLNVQGGVDFSDDLLPGSCRPWVALERRELQVPGNGKARFRYEISPPPDAPAAECRFAIMFEGLDPGAASGGGVSFPVAGRIGVIVYASMSGTLPELKVIATTLSKDKPPLPLLRVENTGAAHGRLTGLLSGTDAAGTRLEFTPASLPILPGETREVPLTANVEGSNRTQAVTYPVTIKGGLEWGGQRTPFEQTFALP